MAEVRIMKAVEYDKLPAKFKKSHPFDGLRAEGYWLQKKYDGCFGMAIIREDGGSQMLSRTGEDYTTSCLHILEELREAADECDNFGSGTEFVVLGEVWHPDLDFPTISGKFRKRARSALKFVANDVLPFDIETAHPYFERFHDLACLLPNDSGEWYCSVADTWKGGQWHGNAKDLATEFKNGGGFDGAILRNPLAGYTIGLVKNGEIIKVKPVLALDLRVTAMFIDRGERTGRVVFSIEVEYKGVRSKVGSGIPHQIGDVPEVGQIVEVECMGLTEDGKLREPRFKGIRHDKEQPDN